MLCRIILTLALTSGISSAAPVFNDPRNPGDALDEVVFLSKWVRAEYPQDAVKEKVGGVVKVSFTADPTGAVVTARALEDPDPRLAAAAIAAVKQWKVEPVLEDGYPVSCGLIAEI